MSENNYYTPGISDSSFIRGKSPMTKEEVRVITLSKLRLNNKCIVVDIGAGTGSISIECGLICKYGAVYAVESNVEGIELIKKNIDKFNAYNVIPVKGMAPEIMFGIPMVDRVIIGGSKGQLSNIMDWVDINLKKQGIIVANFVTIENIGKFMDEIRIRNYKDCQVVQASISKGRFVGNLTLMQAENPVYIVSAVKE